MRVAELRAYYGSSQAVTVVLPQEAADKLIKMREIRVGYNWCTITRKVNIVQCYKCWHYGHTAAKCNGEDDRGKDCHNCGRTGHTQRECNNDKHCPLCDRAGHCAGTAACSEMRQALRVARRKEERRRDTAGGQKETEEGTGVPERQTKDISITTT